MVKPTLARVPADVSLHWRYLHQDKGLTWSDIHSDRKRGYHKFSKATICRHMKKPIGEKVVDKRTLNRGRPRKLDERDRRRIIRQVQILRDQGNVNFTVKRVKLMAGLAGKVSDESVRLVLHSDGLAFRNAAKKGVLKKEDLVKRVEFAKRVQRRFPNCGRDLWKTGIAFYLDGVSFTHKFHPMDQAQAPKKKLWRRRNERLKKGLTAKSNNEGVGGKQAHFLVGIAYGKGVVFCEQNDGRLNGEKFADFVRTTLQDVFKECNTSKRFLQDGDPSQNSAVAREAIYSIGAMKFSIPARSPDLNPIENLFHLAKKAMYEDALTKNITFENWDNFVARCIQTMEGIDQGTIDRTIASLEKRVALVIKNKGERTKY